MIISRHDLLKLGFVTVTASVVSAACSDDTSVRPLGPGRIDTGGGGGTGVGGAKGNTGGAPGATGGAKGTTGGNSANTGGKATGSGGAGSGTGGANANTGGKATGGTSSGTGGANANTGGKATGGATANTGGTGTGGANANTGGSSGTVTCASVTATIATNHPGTEHALDPMITAEDVMGAMELMYDLSEGGATPHTHSITVTAADFAKLAQGMTVTVTSDNVEAHTHVVTLKCGA